MGSSRWDADAWKSYASASTTRSASGTLFTSSHMVKDLNPHGVTRESRDSVLNPNSTPIAVFLDVTGSMGFLADEILTKGLGTLAEEILKRLPVTDPHILFGGVGDANCDSAPLQVTQFEADLKVAEQLEKVWLEKGGGGNCFESYDLPWYFAAEHTATDAWEKRQKKGYLFTVGDEEAPHGLTRQQIETVFGDTPQTDYTAAQLLEMVERRWEVFHIMVEEGSFYRRSGARVKETWSNLLGQRAIPLANHKHLAEVIVSAIEVNEGRDSSKIAGSWGGSTSDTVSRAIANLDRTGSGDASTGIVRL